MDYRDLKVKVFVDTADLNELRRAALNPMVKGATTNPSLSRKAGITNYPDFVKEVVSIFPDKPVSLEVIADEPEEMRRQARRLASFGSNVYVKIPCYNTKGTFLGWLMSDLLNEGIKVNCTAVMDARTIERCVESLKSETPSIISIFCGRIQDSSRAARPYIRHAVSLCQGTKIETLWASARQIYNVVEADACECSIITIFPAFLDKLPQFGRDLHEYEIDTVKMFYDDSVKSGFTL